MANVAGLGPCAVEIDAVAGGRLTDAELEWVVDQIAKRRQKIVDIDNIDKKIAEYAQTLGEEMKLAAALQKKHAALNIIARDKLSNKVNKLLAKGTLPHKAILAIFDGTSLFRDSVFAAKLGFEVKFVGGMIADLVKEAPVAVKMLRNDTFAADVLREMKELYEGGTQGITKNKDAQITAKILARHAEISRTTMNSLGANIGRLDGWTPQLHNPSKMLNTTAKDWAERLLPKLDREKSFPNRTDPEIVEELMTIYETIVTGRGNSLTAKRTGEYVGPINIAKTLGKHRTLHFKDADSWITYNAEFGSGNVMSAMINHQRHFAQMAAEMQTFGPNPEYLLDSYLDELAEQVKKDPKLSDKQKEKEIGKLRREGSELGLAFDESRGYTFAINRGHRTAAEIGAGIRAWQGMSKLGGSVISSVTDLVTQAANLKYNGIPLMQAYHDQVIGMIKRASGGDTAVEKEIAFLLGEGFDGITHHVVSAAYAHDAVPGKISNAMINFFKFSGLTWWTDTLRAIGGRMLSANLGQKLNKSWAQLDDQLRFVMEQHGLTETHWKLIQKGDYVKHDGKTYVTPDRLALLDLEEFTPLIEGKATPAKLKRARLDAEIALAAFFADEVNGGMIEVDSRTRRFLLRGTAPGTLTGEALRMISQFKAWPVTFTHRVLGRAVFGQRTGTDAILNAGHLITGMFIAGYAAMTAKDYLKGYDRKKFFDAQGNPNIDTLFDAMKQGGAAGVFGDLLFSKMDYGSGGIWEAVAGPAPTTISDIAELMMTSGKKGLKNLFGGKEKLTAEKSKAANLLTSNTPFANIFYIKPIIDWLAFNALKDAANPGLFDRQRRDNKKKYGQGAGLWSAGNEAVNF